MKADTTSTGTSTAVKARRWRTWKIILFIVAVLIAIRVVLPYVALHYLNKSLANLEGYFGHVQDLDLYLIRGAYQADSIYINKVDSVTKEHTEILNIPKLDISVEWKSLFKGKIVSEIYAYDPVLKFTENAAEPVEMEKDTNDFRKLLRSFTPLSVNRFEIFNGTLAYHDPTIKPELTVNANQMYVLASNLSNVNDTSLLPAKVHATANVYGGKFEFNMRINALAENPTYDLNATISKLQLTELNPMFDAYADFDVNKGTMDAYMEIAAKDKKFIGYVKPVIADLDVVGKEDRKDPFFRKLWEGLVGVGKDLLENDKTDQVATKIPLAGSYNESTVGVWYAILAALRNGFIQGLYPSVDNQINIGTPGKVGGTDQKKDAGFFKSLLGKPGTPTEKKKEKEKSK